MHRKLLLSSISIAATAALLGAGVYAKYSDTETSSNVSVTAGTLNLVVDGTAVGQNFSFDNAYPGYASPGLFGYVLKNTGSLPGNLHVYLVKDVDEENSLVEPETDALDEDVAGGEIDNFLMVTVDGNSFGYPPAIPSMGLNTVAVGGRIELTSMIWGAPVITIAPGGQYPAGPAELWFGYKISADATNAIMTDTLGFHLEFTLEQQV
jgi:predicted ribosomally synthesized peptide with SipW-like signal peptide